MLANFCYFLIRIVSPKNLALSFLGTCLVLFPMTVHSAWGQVTQEEFQPPALPDSLQYQMLVSQANITFFEFSGTENIDDPLDNFFTYVIDPINWDPTEPIERRMVYRTRLEFQTRQRIFSGTSSLSIVFETRLEHAQVYSLPSAKIGLARISHSLSHNPAFGQSAGRKPW